MSDTDGKLLKKTLDEIHKNEFKEDEIKWDKDGLTGIPMKNHSRRVYKLLGFIQSYVYCTLGNLKSNPEIISNKSYNMIRSTGDRTGPYLSDIWPKSYLDEKDLIKHIRRVTFKEFNKYILEDPDSKMDNFTFLIRLAFKRNWRKNCAICHVDNIKGNKCSCECLDIVVLRPCGHSICLKPCFENWAKNNLEFKPRVYSGNGFTLVDQTAFNVDLDLRDKKLKCPACQVLIEETFQTYYTRVNKSLADRIITKIYKRYTNEPFVL